MLRIRGHPDFFAEYTLLFSAYLYTDEGILGTKIKSAKNSSYDV